MYSSLEILEATLTSLGFLVLRDSPLLDNLGRNLGMYPLVIPKQGDLHSDIYITYDKAYRLNYDDRDKTYIDSLNIQQRYAQLLAEHALKNFFVVNVLQDGDDIYYQATVDFNVKVSKDGEIHLTGFSIEGLPFVTTSFLAR